MRVAISVSGLSKTFTAQNQGSRKIKALDNINLDIYEGEILGILGPNGAGKTTFLNTLSTLLLPDTGTIDILGIRSIPKNFGRLRSLLNMSSGYPNFPWSLTIEENLRFYGKLYGLSGEKLNKKIEYLVGLFELKEFAKSRFDELSSGTKQRLSLAKALLNEPKIIFLDEPTVGLDPDVSIKTREIILKILKASKVTVLLTTHNMHEAEWMCERIAFIKGGRILRLATPKELKSAHGDKDLEQVFVQLAQEKTGAAVKAVERAKEDELAVEAGPVEDPSRGITAWFKRSFAFSYRNFIFAIRNVFFLVEMLFWPVVTLISIGLMGDFLQLQEKAFAFVMTGAIAAGILQVTQLDVAYSLLYEVWSKSMKHTLLAPVGVSENLFGSWLIGIARGTAIFGVLGLSAFYFFGFKFPSFEVTVVFLIGIFCCSFLLGLIVSVLILSFGQKAEITAWMFAYLFMLVCGIYYPIDTLPRFFYNLAQLVPITYFLEYFRQSFGFTAGLEHVLLKGFGLIILYLFAGLALMNNAFDQARKKGIIVRLSE